MSGEGGYTAVQLDEKKSNKEDNDLEEPFDENFWKEVQKKFEEGKSWNRAMDEVRIERLFKKHDKDCLLVIIKDWPISSKYKGRPDLVASLEYLISRFTKIMLEKDTDEDYKYYRDATSPAEPTLLHLAAQQNFLHVATHLVERYPAMVYLTTKVDSEQREYLPVELALEKFHDETAAFLISRMKSDWVHELFLYDSSLGGAKFSFGQLISHRNPRTNKPDMNKTVVAVLNSLVNPLWPYLPVKDENTSKDEEENIDRAWASVPDDPLNYDFFYHVLESDDNGREPKIDEVKNVMFDAKSKSCLHRLTENKNEEAIQHPVVRRLVKKKWEKFALKYFSYQAILYTVFLALLSFALIYGATREDPRKYDGPADYFRLFCEVLSIIFVMVYILEEIRQLVQEFKVYFKDPYNYFDWLGLIFTLLVLPLRFADVDAQWSVASLGYLFNFLRIFKFSCVTRTTGLYTKTLAKIIYQDIRRFLVVFVFICIGFCGALFMALTATGKRQDIFSNYWTLMLAAVRVLTEQQPVEEEYEKFNWFTILILLGYMSMVIVVLLNVLIAQLSCTYSEAKNNAKLQYSIDRMSIITRLERSVFWDNLRVEKYEDKDRVRETDLVEELLEYNEERNPWESMEKKLTLVRDLMRKVVRKTSGKSLTEEQQ